MTEPPSPPRPPSGPPRGLYFSRLKETLPSPPLPARTTNWASSTNCNGARDPQSQRSGLSLQRIFDRYLDDVRNALAARLREAHPARDLGEKRIVGTFADV